MFRTKESTIDEQMKELIWNNSSNVKCFLEVANNEETALSAVKFFDSLNLNNMTRMIEALQLKKSLIKDDPNIKQLLVFCKNRKILKEMKLVYLFDQGLINMQKELFWLLFYVGMWILTFMILLQDITPKNGSFKELIFPDKYIINCHIHQQFLLKTIYSNYPEKIAIKRIFFNLSPLKESVQDQSIRLISFWQSVVFMYEATISQKKVKICISLHTIVLLIICGRKSHRMYKHYKKVTQLRGQIIGTLGGFIQPVQINT